MPALAFAALSAPSTITVDLDNPVFVTNEHYASWTIDSSFSRGFFHINFTNPNLLAAARSLSPATVRFGGSGNDYLTYGLPPASPCPDPPIANPPNQYGPTCLNETHWNAFYGLVANAGLDIVYGLSMNQPGMDRKKANFTWNSTNAEDFLDYTKAHNQAIWGLELGNEVNNKAGQDKLSADMQADAFARLARIVERRFSDSGPVLVGPDSGYLGPKAWLEGFLKKAGPLVHAVTHHVYPGVTRKNWNQTSLMDSILKGDVSWYVPLVKRLAPKAQVWAGEDGPIGGGTDGTCGANSACGTYSTTLWYANDLALRALSGFHQYQRQDLLGGRYGLLKIPHDGEELGPKDPVGIHPDFWINHLWTRIVGQTVLNATVSGPGTIRGFAFCGHPVSPYRAHGRGLALVILNLAANPASVEVPGTGGLLAWTLSASSDGPFGQGVLLNGKALPLEIADGQTIGAIPVGPVKVDADEALVVAGQSTTFLLAPERPCSS